MKKIRFAAILAAALVGSLVATACGSSGGGGGAQAGKEGGTTEVVFWHAMKGANGDAINNIIKGFNETIGKEKHIHVTGVFQGHEITSKLKIASKEKDRKNMPDVTQTVGLDVPTVLRIPGVVKAEDMMKTDTSVKKDEFYKPLLRAFSYKNELVGLPISTSTILLYYNKTALEKAGIKEPPKTIDELAADAKKLTIKEGDKVKQYGLNVKIGRYQLVNFLVEQKPDSFIGNNEGGRQGDMTKVTIGEDGTLKNFLTEWEKVVKSGGYKPTEDNINEEFATGVNAMAIMSSSRIGIISKLVGKNFEWGVSYLPKVTEKDSSGASVGGSCLVMYDNGNAAKKAAAWEFIKYATSPEVQAKWSESTGYLPANVKSVDSMKEFFEKNPLYKVPLEQMKASNPNAQEPFDMVGWQVDGKIADVMLQFAQGKLDVNGAEQKIVIEYNKALDEFWRSNK